MSESREAVTSRHQCAYCGKPATADDHEGPWVVPVCAEHLEVKK